MGFTENKSDPCLLTRLINGNVIIIGIYVDDCLAVAKEDHIQEVIQGLKASGFNCYSLKSHYMTFYWKVRKDFLDFIEDSMSQDTLIGSTISTRSRKSVSCASHISSTSVLSHHTKASKVSEETTHMILP
jgi:hypothetical protein